MHTTYVAFNRYWLLTMCVFIYPCNSITTLKRRYWEHLMSSLLWFLLPYQLRWQLALCTHLVGWRNRISTVLVPRGNAIQLCYCQVLVVLVILCCVLYVSTSDVQCEYISQYKSWQNDTIWNFLILWLWKHSIFWWLHN